MDKIEFDIEHNYFEYYKKILKETNEKYDYLKFDDKSISNTTLDYSNEFYKNKHTFDNQENNVVTIKKTDTIFDAIKNFNKILECKKENVIVDFSNISFIRNQFLSIIGMGLEIQKQRNIKIKILKPKNKKVLNSMNKMNFLSNFCDETDAIDTFDTMIKYTRISMDDSYKTLEEFYFHFTTQFFKNIKNVSDDLKNKILQKIMELFSNAIRHSESEFGFFCSGQFYPASKKFNFTIADNGITIPRNVNEYLKKEFKKNRTNYEKIIGKKFKSLDSIEAIEWALKKDNSTSGSGGLGLSLLIEFINFSNGSIEIISKNGYYSIKNDKEHTKEITSNFPGTIINIEFDVDDKIFYSLKEK